jgi:2-isopropylmalate synthase
MADKVLILDTSLRDGEQSPGVAFNKNDKIEISKALEKMGVDYIEAGFPGSSPGDLEAVKAVAAEIKGSAVSGLARAVPVDVDACWEAVKGAVHPRIHVFLSSSDIHIMHQLEKDKERVLEMARTMVARAKQYTSDVEFSPMDATRSNREYVYRMLTECIDAGATTVNIPDTVGYAIPSEFEQFIRDIQENVANIDQATISVHCHNDLGMAVANSLAAIRAGARIVETCVNGIGERAGNAALEEVVMSLHTRPDFFEVVTNVNTKEIMRASRLVSDLTGMAVQPNKAIVGANAFRHQSGVHQHGVLKMPATYEIIDAREIGLERGTIVVLNKNSGRAGLKARLDDLGYELTEEELSRVFMAFKDLADKKGEIDDRDLEALVTERVRESHDVYRLETVHVSSGNHTQPVASVRIVRPDGEIKTDAAVGDGPVDAVCKAIDRIVGVPAKLTEFNIKAVTEGLDAQGEVTIRIESDGRTYVGRGADTDIIVASAKAYMNALNRLLATKELHAPVEVETTP